MTCALCNRPVDPRKDRITREVSGWEKPGRGAGNQSGSSLVLREPTGRVAHVFCVTAIRSGLSPSQSSLL